MRVENIGVDFVAYNTEGAIVLLAEAKTRHGTSEAWAAKLRRNMLAHGSLPRAKYFLIITPERMYGWNQENLTIDEVSPEFVVDARRVLASYFAKFGQDPASIGPIAFDLLVREWLTDAARSPDYLGADSSVDSLVSSGLLSSLREAHIEMASAG